MIRLLQGALGCSGRNLSPLEELGSEADNEESVTSACHRLLQPTPASSYVGARLCHYYFYTEISLFIIFYIGQYK